MPSWLWALTVDNTGPPWFISSGHEDGGPLAATRIRQLQDGELRENLSAYDASYIALAELLDCELLTADARLGRAPGIRCSITLVPR
jgi:hypothetical protein